MHVLNSNTHFSPSEGCADPTNWLDCLSLWHWICFVFRQFFTFTYLNFPSNLLRSLRPSRAMVIDMMYIEWLHITVSCSFLPIFMTAHQAGMKTQQSICAIYMRRNQNSIKSKTRKNIGLLYIDHGRRFQLCLNRVIQQGLGIRVSLIHEICGRRSFL